MRHPAIHLAGDIRNVLFSKVTPDILEARSLANVGFSFGLGAVDTSANQAQHRLGELWTMPGLAAVLEAEHPGRPSISTTPEETLFSPFHVNLAGVEDADGRELLSGHEPSKQAGDLWHDWAGKEGSLQDAAPLFGAVFLARVESFRGAWVKQTPLIAHAPADKVPINDPSVHAQWFGVDPDGGYRGLYALVVGVALNRASKDYPSLQGRDRSIFYQNPGETSARNEAALQIHQHALLIRPNNLPPATGTFLSWTRNLLAETEIADVKHVLDDTLFSQVTGVVFEADEIHLMG